jgi:hypothetical protein
MTETAPSPKVEQRHRDAAARALSRGYGQSFEQMTEAHVTPDRLWQINRAAETFAAFERDLLTPSGDAEGRADFQQRVQPWMIACFGEMIAGDREERNHRFLEEALELVQACGCTASEAHQLVDYVYGRPIGEPSQEVGGVMVTLAALCLANGLDMHANAETELARIWTKVEAIRAKQAAKPKHSPLPEATAALTPPPAPTEAAGLREAAQFLLWQFDRKGPVADSLEAWEALRAALAKSPPAAVGTNRG